MAKTIKMADIAGRLGVSVVTVSKALSGQKGVSDFPSGLLAITGSPPDEAAA